MGTEKKLHGRPKGALNKRTIANQKLREEAVKGGITPLDYMLKIMRDPKANPKRRDEMAKSAAPYMHAKLVASDVNVKGQLTMEMLVGASMRPKEPAGK